MFMCTCWGALDLGNLSLSLGAWLKNLYFYKGNRVHISLGSSLWRWNASGGVEGLISQAQNKQVILEFLSDNFNIRSLCSRLFLLVVYHGILVPYLIDYFLVLCCSLSSNNYIGGILKRSRRRVLSGKICFCLCEAPNGLGCFRTLRGGECGFPPTRRLSCGHNILGVGSFASYCTEVHTHPCNPLDATERGTRSVLASPSPWSV